MKGLLARGADCNISDLEDDKLLIWAAEKGRMDVIDAVVAAGANANKVDDFSKR